MLDHYYTPRDLPLDDVAVGVASLQDEEPIFPLAGTSNLSLDSKKNGLEKDALRPRDTILHDLRVLTDFTLEFDCDSGSEDESGSDDGYVSTLLRLQRQRNNLLARGVNDVVGLGLGTPERKIAGARRVARAVSSPQAVPRAMVEDIGVGVATQDVQGTRKLEGEVFQSITAIPGLESMSFEELRLETYLQSLIATGTARPQPAFCAALVIPPAFSAQFCEAQEEDGDGEDGDGDGDVEMGDVLSPSASTSHPIPQAAAHPPFVFRAASYPPAHAQQWGGGGFRFGA
ncbi:hypothetical protein C8F04DRAFT_1396098 [Mycena alexandri]|uniref:Uncharacterized protein n=1 Tax=Mycena alexandri TaxID=1745969 RepID=A0AAD6SU81_9AGAR|nr:hypothetical protein C8F04DRAFT_1396098 [Mycena alexandri]